MGDPPPAAGPGFGAIVVATTPDADVDLASGLLWDAGVLGIEERPIGGGSVQLRAGVAAEVEAGAVVAALGERWPVDVEVLEDDTWLDAWQEHATPVEVGEHLVVVPTWVAGVAVHGDRAVIDLPPHRAFGSGAHPTTRLALEQLERLVRPGATVLDVGCGSGLLAVAAARLGASRVVAVDVDPEAVRATAATAAANGVSGVVEVSLGPVAEVEGRFDVVVANIVLPVLLELLEAMLARVGAHGTTDLSTANSDRFPVVLGTQNPGGALLLSGVLDEQVAALIAACRCGGAVARRVGSAEGWSVVRAG
jgi:ribosomal protein L11 methyltransferase